MKVLSEDEVRERLSGLPGWTLVAGAIVSKRSFDSFPAAIAFVNRVAELAETADHHPDIDIRYDQVTLALVTHSAGGITARDIRLAQHIDGAGAS